MVTITIAIYEKITYLTHLFPVHPFSTPWKHKKTLRCSDGGGEKRCIENKWVKKGNFSFFVAYSFIPEVHLESCQAL